MRRALLFVLVFALVLSPLVAEAGRRSLPVFDPATDLLERMTPEERIGQLFLVTFKGSAPRPDDPVFDLIANGHISGVVVRARNNNFVDAPNTLAAAQALIISLQTAEYEASQEAIGTSGEAGDLQSPVYVPLFVAVSQEGDTSPFSEILSGVTDLPSEMAIGATWDPSLARSVGEVLGGELEALGFNMLLGPSIDVLENPRPEGPGDLGVGAFGGDPFWVGMMGKAYIAGVHVGSHGGVAVVANHFPGHGGSDRPLDEEVPTVRKSLEQLKRIELAPFFAVTDAAPGEEDWITDALLRSHIRYQGFQDNIRATTRPVSLDPQASAQIMSLEPLATWRAAGGVTISDSLGSRAIRRFYDPRELSFRGHLVARDAFLAGNDLLLLSSFQSSEDPDEATTIRFTLAFFAQKYREDSLFAERVDEAVLRILRLKMRLYGGAFSFAAVLPREGSLANVGRGQAVTEQVARAAATLINPSLTQVEDRLGGPPKLGERIVFITDVRLASQCSVCEPVPGMDVRALEETVLRMYGPRAAGEVGGWNLRSYTMADLAAYLGEHAPSSLGLPIAPAEEIEDALASANWLVFSTLGSNDAVYGSNALKLLLDRRPDLAQQSRIVVFAHGVPYDLDATDLSKISVYYGLYAQSSPFVDVAARLLFQELSPLGASPVSIPGIGYDLLVATSPDPDQVISLVVRSANGEQTPEASSTGYSVGDLVHIQTGVILDHNGHLVPDGTVVEIMLSYQGESVPPLVLRATTVEGVAEADVTLERLGLLAIAATSDPALASEILQLNVQEGVPAYVTVIAPTPLPTVPQPPTETPLVPTPSPSPGGEEAEPGGRNEAGLSDLLLGLASVGIVAVVGSTIGGSAALRRATRRRCLLAAVVGGLLAYNYLGLGLPGSSALLMFLSWLAGPTVGILGSVGGLIGLRIWSLL